MGRSNVLALVAISISLVSAAVTLRRVDVWGHVFPVRFGYDARRVRVRTCFAERRVDGGVPAMECEEHTEIEP
jgi:hypothetical protein